MLAVQPGRIARGITANRVTSTSRACLTAGTIRNLPATPTSSAAVSAGKLPRASASAWSLASASPAMAARPAVARVGGSAIAAAPLRCLVARQPRSSVQCARGAPHRPAWQIGRLCRRVQPRAETLVGRHRRPDARRWRVLPTHTRRPADLSRMRSRRGPRHSPSQVLGQPTPGAFGALTNGKVHLRFGAVARSLPLPLPRPHIFPPRRRPGHSAVVRRLPAAHAWARGALGRCHVKPS